MNDYLLAFKHATDFSGRTQRAGFWWFMLINLLITCAIAVFEVSLDNLGWIDLCYSLVTLLPILSISCRRLRDTGLSLWWFLLLLVPGVGLLFLLILLAFPSQPEPLQEQPL
ncbi:DUF805 domain-containing protein [Rhodanobacter aciditrophus]|uniref:DUF805 domain-containing protein n=1 Tax=Rhodanobacter aciditrophus TaxID=1623218 RepID=A0ABW4AYT1_9GAMM